MKFLSRLTLLASIFVTMAFVYLFYLEAFNYDNYVFSALNLNLKRFAFFPGVLWAIWTSFFLWQRKIKALYAVFILIFCLVSIPPTIQNIGNALARTHQMFLGREYVVQKIEAKAFGSDLSFIRFIRQYLANYGNTMLIIPPNELPWRHTGNSQIMDGFLFPNATTNNINYHSPFVLISSEEDGASYHLWPDFIVPAEEIVIFNWDIDEPTIIKNKDWNPDEWQGQKPWGLIIKKTNE